MINTALMKYDFKVNKKLIFCLSIIMSVAVFVLALVLGKKSANPEGQVLRMLCLAFFDGGLMMMVSIVFCVIIANSSICSMVNSGSLACILSSDIKRDTVSFTQSIFLLISTLIFNAILTVFMMIAFAIRGFDVSVVALLGTDNIALMIACAGISFMLSCIFNTSKKTFASCGILFGFFYLMKILVSYVSSEIKFFENFKYINLLTLYDTAAITAKSTDLIWQCFSLVIIGILCFVVGNFVFSKKDLPI